MKNNFFSYSLIILFTFMLFSSPVITTEQVNKSRFVKDHFMVKLKKDKFMQAAGWNSASKDMADYKVLQNIADNLRIQITSIKKLFPASGKLSRRYEDFELGSFYKISISGYKDIQSLCAAFENNNNVDYSEPDFVGEAAGEKSTSNEFRPNDEFFARQWGLYNDGSTSTTRGRPGKV